MEIKDTRPSNYDTRIFYIIKSVADNVEDLKVPIESIISRIHRLGITGNEDAEKIKQVAADAISMIKKDATEITGLREDVGSIGSILGKMFKL